MEKLKYYISCNRHKNEIKKDLGRCENKKMLELTLLYCVQK